MILEGKYRYLMDDKPIGHSSFGITFRGTCLETGDKVKIKIRKPERFQNWKVPEILCPNYRDFIQGPDGQLFLVEEFFEGLDLKSYVRLFKNYRLPPEILKIIVKLVLLELEKFEKAGWVHGDIKPSNIILQYSDKNNNEILGLRLIDLDTAAPAGKRLAPYSFVYSPPELILGHHELYGIHGDLYSLAIVIWELFVGKTYLNADHPALLLQLQMSRPLCHHKNISHAMFEVLKKATQIPTFGRPPQTISASERIQAFKEAIYQRYHHVDTFRNDFFNVLD